MKRGKKEPEYTPILQKAHTEILLSRAIPCLDLVEKGTVQSMDIVSQVVSYISGHFQEQVTLGGMAKDLGLSPYALSRIFSGTFHQNFNKYLNEARLEYAVSMLRYTDRAITWIYEDAGFESQRTFNRVFQEKYHMSPREYRKSYLSRSPVSD